LNDAQGLETPEDKHLGVCRVFLVNTEGGLDKVPFSGAALRRDSYGSIPGSKLWCDLGWPFIEVEPTTKKANTANKLRFMCDDLYHVGDAL
jgi:hypothetical protein